MAVVAIQRGHCFRTRGSTGTSGRLPSGERRTEQHYADTLAHMVAQLMRARGHHVYVLTADERVPPSDIFLAFHQDGSSSYRASGASVGYPASAASARYASVWKATYQLKGWGGGFRADNYTSALRSYYGYRRSSAGVKVLMEHGFATNPAEQGWMWSNLSKAAEAHADALDTYLGDSPGKEAHVATQHYKNVPQPTLRSGSRGDGVKQLQALLAAFAAKGTVPSPGPVDGAFGAKTAASLKGMQRVLKLTQDGVYGRHTAQALSAFRKFLDGIAAPPAPAPAPAPPAPAPVGRTLSVGERLERLETAVEWLQAGVAALAAKADEA